MSAKDEPICAKCGKKCALKYVKALGKSYHTYHFVCSVCNVMLKDKPYYEVDGEILCQNHYSEKHGQKCRKCEGLIEGSAVKYRGGYYHEDCFVCGRCSKVLEGAKFFEHGEQPYCKKCVEMVQKMENIRASAQNRSTAKTAATNIVICDECIKEIPVGSKIVKAIGKKFHVECFNCTKCGANLAGKKYFESLIDYKKSVICEKCEEEENPVEGDETVSTKNVAEGDDRSICSVCDKEISDVVVKAMDKEFHKECFVCSNCKASLQGRDGFMSLNDVPWCLKCYENVALPVCDLCRKKVQDLNVVKSQDGKKKFHEKCFVCATCGESLMEKGYIELKGKLHCAKCVAKKEDRMCAKCKKVIVKDALRANGKIYHIECFVCKKCGKQIAEKSFFMDGDEPLCSECTEEKTESEKVMCAKCGDQIIGQVVIVGEKKYHEKCFNCDKCAKNLEEGKYFEWDGKYLCRDCHKEATKERDETFKTYAERPKSHGKVGKPDSSEVQYPLKEYPSDDDTVRKCAGCGQEIFSQYTKAIGRFWHSHHFCCANCESLLDSGFKTKGGKPYCLNCL